MDKFDICDVQVIATLDELRQIGIPEDAGIQNQYMKAWDFGIASSDRFGGLAKVGEQADDDWWYFHIPIKWLRFIDKQEVLLNDLIKQSNETSRN